MPWALNVLMNELDMDIYYSNYTHIFFFFFLSCSHSQFFLFFCVYLHLPIFNHKLHSNNVQSDTIFRFMSLFSIYVMVNQFPPIFFVIIKYFGWNDNTKTENDCHKCVHRITYDIEFNDFNDDHIT